MFVYFFNGAKCRLSECKGNSFTLPGARQLDVVTAGYATAKKKETGILEHKKGETISFYKKIFF